MKVNQLSQGFPQYLSHRQFEQVNHEHYTNPVRRIEFNDKRNRHQNIFSDQYHSLPSTQVKNPFLRQEFKIGETKKQWVQLVDEKILAPVEVYDCLLDKVQTVPRETIFMKNKDLYPQYYKEALNEEGKKEFRRQSGAFMQQISEINKMKPIIESLKTPVRVRYQSQSQNDNGYSGSGSNNNFSSRVDISSDDKQQKSYSYQSRPSLLKQSMLVEKSNFFTPNFKEDDTLAEEKRNLYLNHDPKYINEIEHTINKELIQDSMKQKSKSMLRLHRDLKGQFELKESKQLESNPTFNSLEKINDLKRSIEFQQFDDELTKFEKSLKAKKKTHCVWMNNSNSKDLSKSQFMKQSQQSNSSQPTSQQLYFQSQSAQNSPILQLKTNQSQSSLVSTKKQQSEYAQPDFNSNNSNVTENINTPSFSNLYNFNFKPSYSSQAKLDSPQETQNKLVYS